MEALEDLHGVVFPLEAVLPELGFKLQPGRARTHPFIRSPVTAAIFKDTSSAGSDDDNTTPYHSHCQLKFESQPQSPTPSQCAPQSPAALVRSRFLETLDLCHNWRDMLWRQDQPNELFWQQVCVHADWSRHLDWSLFRNLILSVVSQIAFAHATRPLLIKTESGDKQRMTQLSVAALRFARDMEIYEKDKRRNGITSYLMSSHVRFEGEWALDGFLRMASQRGDYGESKRQEEFEWLCLLFVTGDESSLFEWIRDFGGSRTRKEYEKSPSP